LAGAGAALLTTATGCTQSSKASPAPAAESAAEPAAVSVTLVQPQRTTLRRTVRQPGSIQAFERTPLFAKIPGYIEKWNVDIGDHVRQGDVLAELYVPEMVAELKQKEELVKQAREAHEVARARVASATAFVQEVEAGIQRATANQKRWQLEYNRIAKLTGSVLDAQTKDETWNQLQAASAALKEAEAKVASAQAALKEAEAVRNKTQVDIAVADADRARTAALLGYAKLPAPYAGVVTRRNVNTGDFVQPPSAGKGEPLYVVERRDLMRVLVDVPEADADWVTKGTKARIQIQVLRGPDLSGEVARTSYALDRTARTLTAEIDLPNPQDRLRPGMYVSASLIAEQPNVLTLPASAIVTQGDVLQGYQSFCFLVVDGKAWRTPIQMGARGGDRVEVLKKQSRPAKPGEEARWEDFTGQEQMVANNPASLTDGQAVSPARP
jgi:multidrug efflux pump subunit AcrA (membrane-fusion protein)